MEKHIDQQFTDAVKQELFAAYATDKQSVKLLGDFENYVYSYQAQDGPRIIRVSHRSHRSAQDIQSELDWVTFVADQQLPLMRPLPSEQDEQLKCSADGQFIACAFEYAPGQLPGEKQWTPELFEQWGELTAKLHQASVGYQPDPQLGKRFDWRLDPHTVAAQAHLQDDPELLELFHQKVSSLQKVSQEAAGYGLIHNDIHQQNFHVADGRMLIFDSDDCCYHWYVQDVAVILYHAQWHPPHHGDSEAFMGHFFAPFWRGYRRYFELDPDWLDFIPELLLWRDLIILTVLEKKLGDRPDERFVRQCKRLRNNLVSGTPCIQADFRKLASRV